MTIPPIRTSRGPRKTPPIRATVAVAGLLAHRTGDKLPGGWTRGGVAGTRKINLRYSTYMVLS